MENNFTILQSWSSQLYFWICTLKKTCTCMQTKKLYSNVHFSTVKQKYGKLYPTNFKSQPAEKIKWLRLQNETILYKAHTKYKLQSTQCSFHICMKTKKSKETNNSGQYLPLARTVAGDWNWEGTKGIVRTTRNVINN